MCEMLNDDQRLDFMNFIKEYMKDKMEFSAYSIFCDFRDAFDLYIRYSDVKNDVRDIVRTVINEVGGYDSEFVKNNGITYLEYFPTYIEDDEEFAGYDEENADEEDADIADSTDDENDENTANYTIYLNIDSKGRVFIPSGASTDAKLSKSIFVIDDREENDCIILTSTEPLEYDKVINGPTSGGFHVSVGKYFKNKDKLEAEVNLDMEEIVLK